MFGEKGREAETSLDLKRYFSQMQCINLIGSWVRKKNKKTIKDILGQLGNI